VYRPVTGRLHPTMKNNFDWLRFVFERWFYAEAFCLEQGIAAFFTFDSDTVIAADLGQFLPELRSLACTAQCNDACMNGFVTTSAASAYTSHMTGLFNNPEYLAAQQREFDEINPGYAFTEMRAYVDFRRAAPDASRMRHLAGLVPGWWFDDCLMQEHDFVMERSLLLHHRIKKVHFRNQGFWGEHRTAGQVRFATLNLSWLPDVYFKWALERIPTDRAGGDRLSMAHSLTVARGEFPAWARKRTKRFRRPVRPA